MTASDPSVPAPGRMWVVALLLATGCASSPGTGPESPEPPVTREDPVASASSTTDLAVPVDGPGWLSVSADYPRYLHHLRRLNLQTVNAGPADVYVSEHVLRAEHFAEVAPERDRTSTVWADSQVDIQSDFGEVVSCEDSGPFLAWVEYRYTTSLEPAPTWVRIPIDPTPLDEIRDRECAQQAVWEVVDIRFGDATRSGATVDASIVFERVGSPEPVLVESMLGSVIFTMAPEGPLPAMAPGDRSATVPVRFDVARCDPHAVGQSTKTYELSVWVAVGERPAQAVAIPLHAGLRTALDEALAECLAGAP